ncbi:hypothetical protein SPB21_06340 [Leptothoe sp. ISB3NOV94-8A]
MKYSFESLPRLTIEDAHNLLAKHSFTHEDLDDPEMANGFLGSLRPYRGSLNQDAFLEIMACLKAIGPGLSTKEQVQRKTISNLWGICHLARDWATHPDGMLRRNNLISDADVATISQWIDCISYATMMFLDCQDPKEAFAQFEDYFATQGNAG